jgi:hypothetical protein
MGGTLTETALCESCGSDARCKGLSACVRCLPAVCGFTHRQLYWWVTRGYVRPRNPLPGSGRSLEWPGSELEIARRMAVLVKAGIAVSVAAKFARDGWPSGEIAPGIRIQAGELLPDAMAGRGAGE